jgi:hypothetical protein
LTHQLVTAVSGLSEKPWALNRQAGLPQLSGEAEATAHGGLKYFQEEGKTQVWKK